MKTFVALLVLAVAAVSASHWDAGHAVAHYNPAAHIPSGSVSVGRDGATVAGPAGSVSTDNGVHSGRAGARVAGPSGTVAGWGAHGVVEGPAGVAGAHGGWANGGWGNGGWGNGWGAGYAAVAPAVAHNPAAHIPSGSVSVGPNGATVAGPAGSVSTDNGVHSGRAGARVAGPAGTVAGWGAHGIVEGPAGVAGAHGGWTNGWNAGHVAPVAAAGWGARGYGWGHGGWGAQSWGHGW